MLRLFSAPYWLVVALALLSAAGCRSMNYAERGTVFGGLTGAGVGALVGDAAGNAGAGAAIGTAIGAITGTAIGENIDQDIARSNAEIEARLGRQMQGAVTPQDVIAMTQAGLSDEVIATHVRANGMAQPLAANDLIQLRNYGVRDGIINVMQQTPPRGAASNQPLAMYPATYPVAAAPVMVAPYGYPVYGAPVYGPPPPPPVGFYYRQGPRGRVGFGVSTW